MCAPRTVVGADHLDLLVTAAVRYRVLPSRVAAALSTGPGQLRTTPVAAGALPDDPTTAGRLLLEQNLAAARWRAARGRGALDLQPPSVGPAAGDALDYQHRPVEQFEPVEVIKAAHCYQHLTGDSPDWAGSDARRLVTALAHAATHRLPGYSAATWHWTRPPARTGAPVGLRRSWVPAEDGVEWVTPAELAQRWDDAALVLISAEALDDVPAGMRVREAVYLCTRTHIDAVDWPAVVRLQPDVVVTLPTARDWLLEQLADPARATRRNRLDPGTVARP